MSDSRVSSLLEDTQLPVLKEIDSLLDIDAKNISLAREYLGSNAGLLETMNRGSELYGTCRRLFGSKASKRLNELYGRVSEFGVSTVEGLKDLPDMEPKERREEALHVQGQIYAIENRGMLLARMSVLYSQSMCDILRFRMTHPLAGTRLQCESVALMELMRSPKMAIEWRNIVTDKQGQSFFKRYRGRVSSTLKVMGLKFAYDNASGIAMHSRFAGVALGLDAIPTEAGYQIKVKAQEFDSEHPQLFLLTVLHIMRVQDRIFEALAGLPEMDDLLYRNVVGPKFRKSVDNLFNDFTRQNAELVRQYREDLNEDDS